MSIGTRIQELRRMRGYTQKELADKAGLTQQAVSKIERDKTSEPWTLDRIAAALEVHPILLRYEAVDLSRVDAYAINHMQRAAALSDADRARLEDFMSLLERQRRPDD